MKNRTCLIFALFLSLLLGSESSTAQCNNQIDIATDCDFIFLIDGNIIEDGFCSSLPVENPVPQLTPFCQDLSSSENTGFFLIEPTTSTLFLRIKPMDCTQVAIPGQGIFSGMQAAIFEDCSFQNFKACSPLCISDEFLIGGTDFIPFQTYILAFDGCHGALCDFEIEIHSGAINALIPLVDPVLISPETVCSNEAIRIQVEGLPIRTEGIWNIAGSTAFETLFNGKAIEINDWNGTGIKEICAQINDPETGEMYFDSCWNVNVLPAPVISNFTADQSLCFSDQLNLSLEGTDYANILWTGPGLNCNNCQEPILTMPDSSIMISATASNTSGCQEIITMNFELSNDPNCLVGIDNIGAPILDIAPNPFQNFFTFQLQEKSAIIIYNTAGEEVFLRENMEGDQRLETSNWPSGLYLIQVHSKTGIGSQRLLKL